MQHDLLGKYTERIRSLNRATVKPWGKAPHKPILLLAVFREIEQVNANFARVETIKKFFLIERQLTPEDEELTPTMKLKRSFVNTRYAAEIDAMYRAREVA